MKNTIIKNISVKQVMLLITYTILLIYAVINMNVVLMLIQSILGITKPFFYGFMMAYLFNIPLKYFMRILPDKLGKMKKSIAVLCALLIVVGILGFLVMIVFPTLFNSVAKFVSEFPSYIGNMEKVISDFLNNNQGIMPYFENLAGYAKNIEGAVLSFAGSIIPQALTIASTIISGVTTGFFAIVIAIYLIISKDRLLVQGDKFMFAFFPTKVYDKCKSIGQLSNKTFSSFFSGQLVEAIIIGVLCYLGCLLFNFPYAPIMGVIIGVTNVIPIFGAIVGTIICSILITFVSPIQGLLFAVFGTCLQQAESNIIYPRVVGTSVGLSGLWVLFAITIGGGLFNFMGMLFGLPVFSIFYTLIKEAMHKRLDMKKRISKAI